MTEASPGPGWWLASDRKWYPPDLHPDVAGARVASSSVVTEERDEIVTDLDQDAIDPTVPEERAAPATNGSAAADTATEIEADDAGAPTDTAGTATAEFDAHGTDADVEDTDPEPLVDESIPLVAPSPVDGVIDGDLFDAGVVDGDLFDAGVVDGDLFGEGVVDEGPVVDPALDDVEADLPTLDEGFVVDDEGVTTNGRHRAVAFKPLADPPDVEEPLGGDEVDHVVDDDLFDTAGTELVPVSSPTPDTREVGVPERVDDAGTLVDLDTDDEAPRRSRLTLIVVGALLLGGIVVGLIAFLGGDDGDQVAAGDTTTTIAAPLPSISTPGTPTTTAEGDTTAVPTTVVPTTVAPTTTLDNGVTSVFSLTTGTCIDAPSLGEGPVTELVGVECGEPHTHEVYGILEFPSTDGVFDAAAIAEYAGTECGVVLLEYARDDIELSLHYISLEPTQESWTREGDREIVCILFRPDEPLTESVAATPPTDGG